LKVTAAALQTTVSNARITCVRTVLGIKLYPPLEKLLSQLDGAVKRKPAQPSAKAANWLPPGFNQPNTVTGYIQLSLWTPIV
jgi:hypothetical protein